MLINDNLSGVDLEFELQQCGVSCHYAKTIESSRLTTHFFKLDRPKDILKLNQAIKVLEVVTGKAVARTEKAEPCCFGIEISKDNLTVLNLEERLKKVKPYTVLIGEGTDGTTQIVDFDKTPHLLIAGCTGSGKSVLLNNIVKCLIETNKKGIYYQPIIIDPKKVGFSKYDGVEYTEVATTVEQSIGALKNIVAEMYKRYDEMQRKGIDRWKGFRLVLIIDEFADLILTAKNAVENFIVKIAQMGRACGIHLVIATQRPTVNIVTGLIKANIPDRVALRVSSVRDSMVILEQKGAEKLKGQGDCLVKINGETKRVQCFYSK